MIFFLDVELLWFYFFITIISFFKNRTTNESSILNCSRKDMFYVSIQFWLLLIIFFSFVIDMCMTSCFYFEIIWKQSVLCHLSFFFHQISVKMLLITRSCKIYSRFGFLFFDVLTYTCMHVQAYVGECVNGRQCRQSPALYLNISVFFFHLHDWCKVPGTTISLSNHLWWSLSVYLPTNIVE